MMTGVNLDATVRLAQSVSIPIIASGGIAGLQDIKDLAAVESEGIMGAILGRALYEGKLNLEQAQAYADAAGAADAG
jgi:phosphoribosylformimino-5-aminoimidazole carboxamide ribotide isomerase